MVKKKLHQNKMTKPQNRSESARAPFQKNGKKIRRGGDKEEKCLAEEEVGSRGQGILRGAHLVCFSIHITHDGAHHGVHGLFEVHHKSNQYAHQA
jgi:hypothetical protein